MNPSAVMHLITNNVEVPVDAIDIELPLTAYSPDGTMVARTSWDMGMDSDCVLVQMNIKNKFFGMHDHMDAGHFDIYYKGSLAIDSGLYESDPFIDENGNLVSSNLSHGSKHWYGYSRRAIAHNVMLVKDPSETYYEMYNKMYLNDGGQKLEATGGDYEDLDNYNTGKVISSDFGPDLHEPAYSYLKGNLNGAYTDKVENYERSFMFLNLFDSEHPAALIVLDNVLSSNSDFKKTWLLHSQEEPEISEDTTVINRSELGYNGRLVNKTLLPKKAEIEKIGGEGHEWEYDGVNYGAAPKTRTQEAGNWRVEVSPAVSEKQNYFLNVMQMSDNDDSITPLETELIRDDENYVGIKIADRAVFLKKNKKLTIADTVVSANGDEAVMYIIDGMREGKWTVYDNGGKKIIDVVVEEGHNIVSFSAQAGEYKLVWEYMSEIPKKDYSVTTNVKEIEPLVADVQIDKIFESFDNKIYVKNDELYLPIEELLDKINKEYTVQDGVYTIGKHSNSVVVPIERIEKNNTAEYISAKEFCELMGYSYEWDSIANIAYISSGEDIVSKMKLLNSTDPNRIAVKEAVCSSAPYSSPYDTVDGNLGSYWGGQGDGEWIMYEFENESEISLIDIKWHVGDQRRSKFDIYVSVDQNEWMQVYNGESSGTSKTFESVPISEQGKFKYVKIVGHGNSANDWNSISEVRFYNRVNGGK